MQKETNRKSRICLWLLVSVLALALCAFVLLTLFGLGRHEATDATYIFCWNVDRGIYTATSESGLSTREKAEDGLFHIRFVSENGLIELTTEDKQLVNLIDFLPVAAVKMDGNTIIDARDPGDLGYTAKHGVYVAKAEDNLITANSSVAMNGMKFYIQVAETAGIVRACGTDNQLGEKLTAADLMTMDQISTIADAEGNYLYIYLTERIETSSVYWRAEAMYSTTTKETTRVPDEKGVYTVDFFADGERVSLKCKDKALVTAIDKTNRYTAHFALIFDEAGYIIATKHAALGLKAVTGCSNYIVTESNGSSFTAEGALSNELGKTYSGRLRDDCVIIDVSRTAFSEGRQGQKVDNLKVGDRIVCFENVDGEAKYIFVTVRIADVPVYFNLSRSYSTSKAETTRKPNSAGYYEIKVLEMGKQKPITVKTKDKDLVSYIDSRKDSTYGLKIEDGIVLAAYECESMFGYPNIGSRYVNSVQGSVVSTIAYKTPTNTLNMLVNLGVPIYDVSGCGELGAETEIRVGDLVVAHRNGKSDVVCVYVTKRAMGTDHAYWTLDRQYDKEKKVSTREPNEDGYYVFSMAHKGKQVLVKTRSKAVADYIDSQNIGVGLTVKNGIVQYAYDPAMIAGAVRVAANATVKEIAKNGVLDIGSSSIQLDEDCEFINCAEAFKSHKGEYVSSLKVGDSIVAYADMYGKVKVVFIIGRDVDKMYWNIAPYAKLAPDAKGYYNFQLAVDGEVKQMKTKNKELAERINTQIHAFGLVVQGDEFFSYVNPIRVVNVKERAGANWTVIKIKGSKVTLRYDVPGSKEYTGKEKTLIVHSGCHIYDVSLNAENPGSEATLQVGDRVEAYSHDNGQMMYCYVLSHGSDRVAADDYRCPHCDQLVHWEPYNGGHFTGKSGHYYLTGNLNVGTVIHYGQSKGVTPELVLDLNGKTITTTGERAIAVYGGQTLHIMDSVGTGAVQATGITGKNGSALQISDGGCVELWSGTLKMLESDQKVRVGGVVYMYGESSSFTMRGGKITGGKVVKIDGKNSIGGAIYADDGAVTILGGEIDGTSEYQGGAIYATAPLYIENATITGTASDGAGAIYCAGELTVKGCTISGAVQHNKPEAPVLIENSTLSYLKLIAVNTNATLSGKAVINNLNLNTGVKVTLQDLAEGTSIKFLGDGDLTTANEKMAEWLAAGYFVADDGKEFGVTDGVLQYKNPNEAVCPHCNQTVVWQVWDFTAKTSGHFFVAESLPSGSATIIIPAEKELVIDLRGQTINITETKAMTISGKVSILDTVGGGLITGGQTGNGGVLSVQNGGELTLLGGTYRSTAGKGAKKGTVAYVVNGGKLIVDGTAVLDGSNITEGIETSADYSTVYANGAVEIKGGEIRGVQNAPRGGSIFVNTGSLIVSGGTIGGGTATLGDDIFCINANSDIAFTGGIVTGQVQMSAAQSLTISGRPVLNNLKVTSASKITLGELEEGAMIAIAGAGDVSFPNANAKTYLEKGYVKAYTATESLKVTDHGVLYIPFCPHCSMPVNTSTIQWQPWDYNTQTSGHYYLTEDLLNKSGQFSIASDYIVLDLRGHSIHVTDNRVFEVTGNLNIIDTVGGGTITGTLAATKQGGVFYVKKGATLNLYGGTFRATSAVTGAVIFGDSGSTVNIGGSAVIDGSPINTGKGAYGAIFSSGNLNITGGEIIGGYVGSGGSVYQDGGILNISGGYIHGGTASNMGHDIFATGSCTLTISGGEVEKQIRVNKVTTATIAGAPKLESVKTSSGVMLTLGKLLPGAEITMAVEGAFTMKNDNAADYLKYFHANATTKYIYEDAGVLYMTTKPAE